MVDPQFEALHPSGAGSTTAAPSRGADGRDDHILLPLPSRGQARMPGRPEPADHRLHQQHPGSEVRPPVRPR